MDYNKWINPDDNEEDADDDSYLTSTKDTLLFCIDASSSMHKVKIPAEEPKGKKKKKKNNKSHLHQALQCALDVMKRKVIISPNDSVGILLFNTKNKQGDEVMANHFVYQPVSLLSADIITRTMEILEEANQDPSVLEEKFQAKLGANVPIGDVFASCNHVLRTGAPKTSVKRIFYITDEDNPGSLEGPSTKRLEDLAAQGISLVPFFISTQEKSFVITKFYANVLNVGTEEEDPSPFANVCEGFEQVIAEMKIRETPKRSVWSIPMNIAEDFTIGVKGYGLITEQRKPPYKYVSTHGASTVEVESETIYFDRDQQTAIPKDKILYGIGPDSALVPGNGSGTETEEEDEDKKGKGPRRLTQKILFTAEQVKEFRTLGLSPGIKILGFKDRSELHFEDNVKHAYFIYPDESAYIGSTRTFTALLRTLIAKDRIGIALVTMRRNSSPVFCAMLPQPERLDENETQLDPPGINLIPLPFADEIREPPMVKALHCTQDLTDAATDIIKKLTLKSGYQPDAFPNPALAVHYAFLEANALGTEFDPELVQDHTLPNYDHIHDKAGEAIEAWRAQLEREPDANVMYESKTKKRGTSDGVDEAEIRSRQANGNLSKVTVPQLKEFLKHHGQKIPVGAKKADLVELVDNWIESNP